MTLMERKLCDVQGRLFELAVEEGYEPSSFASEFMSSKVAEGLDQVFCHYQWAGERYLLETLQEECGDRLVKGGGECSTLGMHWIGYLYRYWHCLKGLSSKAIYRLANFKTMSQNYYLFHSFSPELAIEELTELSESKKGKKRSKNASSK